MANPVINALRLIDYTAGSANVTKTYATPCVLGLRVENDGASAITIAVNGISVSLPAGKVFDEAVQLTNTFTITAGVAYRCYVRGN